jgi:hypothetical protein
MPVITLEPKHEYALGAGWSRKVTVDGVVYIVGVERGKSVRIAFKPKGQNKGFQWWGFVRDAAGKHLWEGDVPKTFGVRGLLTAARIVDHRCKPGRGECAYCSNRRRREAKAAERETAPQENRK